MQTQCSPPWLEFLGVDRRRVVAAFDEAIGLMEHPAGCFEDWRRPELFEFPLRLLLG